MDPIRRKMLKTGAAATVMAAAPRVLAQQAGQWGASASFYEKGPVRIRYQETGSGFPLLLIAGGGLTRRSPVSRTRSTRSRNSRVIPLRRVGSAQREHRPVLGPAGDRPALGCLHRRPPWRDGSPGHRQVHGYGLLYRRPVHLESAPARAEPCRRRGARAAQRVAPGNARFVLREQHEGLGTGTGQTPARDHHGDGRQVPHEMYGRTPTSSSRSRVISCARARRRFSFCLTIFHRIRTRSRWRPPCLRRTPK